MDLSSHSKLKADTSADNYSYLFRWLGQNSKRNKLSRQLGEVQIRMRLKVSGDKSEIRQTYVPALFPYIVKPLSDTGAVSVGFYDFFFVLH